VALARWMRRFAQWHIWLGWIVGLPVLMWTVTGLWMVARPIEEVRGEQLRAHEAAVDPAKVHIPANIGEPVQEMRLVAQPDGAQWIVTTADGTRLRYSAEFGTATPPVVKDEARRIAREADLDLVEVAPDSRPPVCRLLDYSKYKYEQEQKAKAARRHQKQVNVREIKLRPKIATNDYETKKNHVVRFLKGDDRVKVTIMFRGREMAHTENGKEVLDDVVEEIGDLAVVEQQARLEGRNMFLILAPNTRK